jgi:hypothetical protein
MMLSRYSSSVAFFSSPDLTRFAYGARLSDEYHAVMVISYHLGKLWRALLACEDLSALFSS